MPNNAKKEYPQTGHEQDAIYARHKLCYLKNNPQSVKKAKKSLNKRFRAANKRNKFSIFA